MQNDDYANYGRLLGKATFIRKSSMTHARVIEREIIPSLVRQKEKVAFTVHSLAKVKCR
jgi:hypothetical protein